MQKNKMGTQKINNLIWSMGLPIILSMILQALYNVVDTMFVINMGEEGFKTAYTKSNGYRYYSEDSILSYTQERKTKKYINVIGYAKVSSKKQNDDLDGIIISIIITLLITILYQLFANQISKLFALTIEKSSIVSKEDVIKMCQTALHIATLGYIFMGYSVAIQGILQSFRKVYFPLIISALRLIILVFPLAFIFSLSSNVSTLIWWTFPIAEIITAIISHFMLKITVKEKINLE